MTDSSPVGRTAPVKKAKPRTRKAKPSGSGVARYHYHQNRATDTFVVHKGIDVNDRSVDMVLDEYEFKTRKAMDEAVRSWLTASTHSFDKVAAAKHCN